MCETWGTESVEVLSDFDRKKKEMVEGKIFHAMMCVNLPGVNPMHLRTPRIYHRCAGVGVPILRSKIHCHCNLSRWKSHT